MKFVVSSTDLLNHLQAISRVISSKNTLPILDNFSIVIISANGQFNIVGQNGIDFPQLPSLKKDKKTSLQVNCDVLMQGITKTLFATADDELRPVMNGIFIEL